MTIRYLASEGEQIATLARRFGLSRQTIYNQLARATAAPAPRPRRPSALDAFREYVGARLASFDLPAPVLLRELRTCADRVVANGQAEMAITTSLRCTDVAMRCSIVPRFQESNGRQAVPARGRDRLCRT